MGGHEWALNSRVASELWAMGEGDADANAGGSAGAGQNVDVDIRQPDASLDSTYALYTHRTPPLPRIPTIAEHDRSCNCGESGLDVSTSFPIVETWHPIGDFLTR